MVQNGHIKRLTDQEIQSSVLEIAGTNVSTTYIQCPAEKNKILGIRLPYLMIILKNVRKNVTLLLLSSFKKAKFHQFILPSVICITVFYLCVLSCAGIYALYRRALSFR